MTANLQWTKREEEVLKNMVEKRLGYEEMANVLKSRTLIAIRHRCAELKISIYGDGPEIDMEAFKRLMKGI